MSTIYLDNAATTPMLPEVVDIMQQSMLTNFGNPSSTHQLGRKAKSAIETARKNIAKQFNVSASEIIFTSGGTEADNLILINAVVNLGVKKIITTKIEHHAVLHTIEYLQKTHNIEVIYLQIDAFGCVNLQELEEVLSKTKCKTLVSLMMVNNEIGNLLPIHNVCDICKNYGALFHSDTVQAVGQYKIDLQTQPIDFITASAHKFHGPKGVGFAYFKKGHLVKPMLHGGNQEKGIRSSTENVHSIIGMEKALHIAYEKLAEDTAHELTIKKYFIDELLKLKTKIQFNGLSEDLEKSSAKIVNVRFPFNDSMFLFNLDMQGIAVSGGSACQSGSSKGSHVLQAFLKDTELQKTAVRFSFSKFTTKKDIDATIEKLIPFIT